MNARTQGVTYPSAFLLLKKLMIHQLLLLIFLVFCDIINKKERVFLCLAILLQTQ